RIHHRRADVGATEQLLHRPNVVAVLEQMCGERMPERMWTCSLGDASVARRVGDGFLDDRLMQVKPCRWSPSRISTNPRGGKHDLPSPFGSGVGVLAVQCEWQHDATKASRGVAEMLSSDT